MFTKIIAIFLVLPLVAQAETLSFGVVPHQAARTLAKNWAPLLKEVSKRSGVTLRFSTAKDIPSFEGRLKKGEYDFAYMNPYHYVVFSAEPGYLAMAKQRNKRIQGIIVVNKDSEIKNLEQLAQKPLAFPAPAAFAASVLPRGSMEKMGIPFRPVYVSSHDSVYRNVASGHFEAGGGVRRTLKAVAPEVREKLRVLWSTNTFTPHAIAHHPKLKAEAVGVVLQAFLSLENDELGKKLLKGITFKGIESAKDEDWNDVRDLGLSQIE